jgi:hypothetical protein
VKWFSLLGFYNNFVEIDIKGYIKNRLFEGISYLFTSPLRRKGLWTKEKNNTIYYLHF